MQFLISLFLIAIAAATATAAEHGHSPYGKTLDASNVKFLRELTRQVERAGFRNATVVPQVFLVRVEDDKGKPVLLLVNSDTLQAMILEGPSSALISAVSGKELKIPKLH
jgi:hypothetical protein